MRGFGVYLISVLLFLLSAITASADSIAIQQGTGGTSFAAAYDFPQYGSAQTFTATSTFNISRSDFLLRVSATSTGNGCVRGKLYDQSGGIPNNVLTFSYECISIEDLTTVFATTSFTYPTYTLASGTPYAIGYEVEGTLPDLAHALLGEGRSANIIPGERCALFGSWSCSSANGEIKFFIYTSDEAENFIQIIQPEDGDTIIGNETIVQINYENNTGYTQISFCQYIPDIYAGGGTSCENGGQASAISSSGAVYFTASSATGTRILSVAFGIPISNRYTGLGDRYIDWDAVAVGFGSTTPILTIENSTYGFRATSTEQSLFNCGITDIGCYLKDGLKWAFYPSPDFTNLIDTVSFASSSPFNYMYQLTGYMTTLKNATGTSIVLEVNLFGATTTILDTSQIGTMSGVSTARDIVGWVIWIVVLFTAYIETYTFFFKGRTTEIT